jgi:DNA end-binding protein Ku
MTMRPTWKGFLKVSLVSIPVRVYPASDPAATLAFHQLHADCRTRIQMKKWCPTHDREVGAHEIVKGYEFEKGHYVILTDEDFAKVRPKSTRVIDLVRFADADSIDPLYVERPYYLAPDGELAAQAFAVFREGMRGKTGLGKLALYGREYLVAVQPRERGLVMFTLRLAREVRSLQLVDELKDVPDRVKPEEVKLARQVIGAFQGPLDLAAFRDEYQEQLRQIIEAKIAGREVVAPPEEAPAKVVNLMEALRKSLEAVSAQKKRPAKMQALGQPAARAAPPVRKKRA